MSNQNSSSSESIKCVVRCRPLNAKEKGLGAKCISISADSKVVIVENKDDKNQANKGQYAMDRVFDETVTQEELFKEIGEPILKNFIGGYNCTIFCYGQTGAGKTHTMMGPLDQLFEEDSPSHGLIPRIIHYIFNEKEKVYDLITNNTTDKCKNIQYQVKTCVMELYQEQIIDLLNPNNKSDKKDAGELKVKEDPKKGMYIQGITEAEVFNAKEAKSLILTGLKTRHVAATEMNAESSRSHLLFSIYLSASYINPKNGEVKKNSRLHLIDLAGSERQKKTKAIGERIKEACMINKSLSTLGNVINALVEATEGKGKYIPFRDSKLTYFLKDSLGGNSKTTIVANISCSLMQIGETISTLKFVQRAKMIKNSVSLNVSVQENIETLQAEIKKLKEIIAKGGKYDLSLLDGEQKKEDYICPICHNQPIEISQEQAMATLKNDILNLTQAIVKNFAVGDELKKHLMSLDTEIGKSGIQFFDLVDQYKNEYEKQLQNLGGQVKLLNDFYDEAKEGIEEANKKISDYTPNDPMDRLTFEKVNNLNNTTAEIVKKFKECDVENYNKLKMENQALKKENEIATEVKKMLEEKEKNKENLSEKEKKISDCVQKFVKSNEDIKHFMSEHFLGQPMLKNELVFLEKSKYDLLLFQLDEEKMTNNSLRKQIEDMESENYLINMELSNMRSQLDNFKNFKSLGRLSVRRGVDNSRSLFNASKSNRRLISIKNPNIANINEDIVKNSPNPNVDMENNNNSNNNNNNTFEDDNKKNSISNKLAAEIIKMQESLEDLNEDLEIKMVENEGLQQEKLELEEEIKNLNIKIENERRNNTELKEKLESLYTENDLYEQQIFDLIDFKKTIGAEMEEILHKLNLSYEDNKYANEIFDLYQKKFIDLFDKYKQRFKENEEKDKTIRNLNEKCELYKAYLEENITNINEIIELYEKNNNNTYDLFDNYKKEVDKILECYNGNIDVNNDTMNEIMVLCDNNNKKINSVFDDFKNEMEKLGKFYNAHIDESNKTMNEIIILCDQNNNKVNDLFDIYKNDLEKIIKFYNSNLDKNNNVLNEITKLCDENKNKVNDLFEIYKNDMDKIVKFYNANLAKNNYEIDEIIQNIDKNNDNVNGLFDIYKNDIQRIINFYNANLLKNNKELDEIIFLCNKNNNDVITLDSIFKNEMDKIEKYYNNVYINSNSKIINNINDIIKDINEQKNNLNTNETNINSLFNEMKDVINTLLVKLNLKQKAIIKLKKEYQDLLSEKNNSDTKNLATINELNEDIAKYKNKILVRDNKIKLHLDFEMNMLNEIEEISQQISNNNEIIEKLGKKYNDDLSKMLRYYNNIILYQNKNIINIINNNEITIDEIKSDLKKSNDEADDLVKNYKELNDKYFDKCCSLLNNLSKQDVVNKSLNNKISNLELNNSKLKEEKDKLEEENISIKNDKQKIESINQLNIENNNKLKKNLENNQAQINDLNEEILKYIEQLKTKDELINDIKNEKNKLNFKLQESQNESNTLRDNIDTKNELIKSLQEKINKHNSIVEEYNKKNMDLLKEYEEEKNKYNSMKELIEEKDSKINELNQKMAKLFNEISNKDKIINQHNIEQVQMSRNLNDINDSKNILLNKLSEKEKEILDLQKSNDEINTKLMNINEQNNLLLNECQNKSNEINSLNETIKKNNNLLKLKEDTISKLNKKLKSQKNQILYMDFKNNNRHLMPSGHVMLPSQKGEHETFFDSQFEIDSLKEKNNNLLNEKLTINENQNKLNMKYSVTKILMNLGLQLVKEFNEYKSQKKNGRGKLNVNEQIDAFINEKIEKCNKEINNTQNIINQNIVEKKKINNKLLNEVKNYNESFINNFNQYISNLNELLKIYENEDNKMKKDNKSIAQIIQEILDESNQYNIYEYESISRRINGDNHEEINISELKDIIDKIKSNIINKKEIIEGIIPKLIESYNIIIKEEMNADEQIQYYEFKKQILIDKKISNEDLDKFITEYKNLKSIITSLKEQYNKLKEDFLSYKDKLIFNENLYTNQIEKELLNSINNENADCGQNGINLDLLIEETHEDDEENQKILNEINNLKSNIFNNKKNVKEMINIIDNNKEKEIYNMCKNTDFNFSEKEENIKKITESRDSVEKKIDDLKLNILILNTLPSQYQTYKNFINHDDVIENNKKLEKKLKLVFGNNFNCNYIYNDEKPEVVWRQEEISKLKSDIMILREEKNGLENDLKALRASFDLALKCNGSDNQLIILFKIKEENKILKKEIKQIREKNVKLEEKLKELNYNNNIELINCNKNYKINDFMNTNTSLNGNSILSINDVCLNNNNNNNIKENHNKVIKEYKNNI